MGTAVELSSRETKTSALARLLYNYFKINANTSTVKSEIYVTANCGIRKCDIKRKLFLGARCTVTLRGDHNEYKRFAGKRGEGRSGKILFLSRL